MSTLQQQHPGVKDIEIGNFALLHGIQLTCEQYKLTHNEVLCCMKLCLENNSNSILQHQIKNHAIKCILQNQSSNKKPALFFSITERAVKEIRHEYLEQIDKRLTKNPKEEPSDLYPYSERDISIQTNTAVQQNSQKKWKCEEAQTEFEIKQETTLSENNSSNNNKNGKQIQKQQSSEASENDSEQQSEEKSKLNLKELMDQNKMNNKSNQKQNQSTTKGEQNGQKEKFKNLSAEDTFKILQSIKQGMNKNIVSKENNISKN